MLSVFHTVFATGFFHDPCDRRVMNMADRREKVMLKVKVQSTEGPAQDRALPVKAKGCLRLVDRPGGFNAPCFFGEGEICLPHTMGQLKNHRERYAQNRHTHGVEKENGPQRMEHEGNTKRPGEEDHFTKNEN